MVVGDRALRGGRSVVPRGGLGAARLDGHRLLGGHGGRGAAGTGRHGGGEPHSIAEARGAGLDLRDTTLVIFGNPAAGTPVMEAAPLSALDLPLKVLIWDDEGQAKVTYTAPEALALRYGLTSELAARLAGIGPLTDALVAQ